MTTPFTMHEFKLFAPVTLNGKESYAFLDTGAHRVSVTSSVAKDMEVKGTKTILGASGTLGARQVSTVRMAQLEFLGETLKDIEATVDPSDVRYFAGVPFEVSLTLNGSTILAKPFMLDFKRQHLGFVSPPFRADLVTAPLKQVKGLPFTSFSLGERAVHTVFDLGAGFSVLNAARQGDLAPDASYAYEQEVGEPGGLTRPIGVWQSSSLSFSGLNLGICEFLAIDLSTVEEKIGTPVDFIFGVNTMLTSGRVWLLNPLENHIGVVPHGVSVTA